MYISKRWISLPYFSKLTIEILLLSGTTPELKILITLLYHSSVQKNQVTHFRENYINNLQNAMLYFQQTYLDICCKIFVTFGAFYAKKNLKTPKKTQKSKVTKQAPILDDLLGNKARWGVTKPTMCCESRSISKAETGWFLSKRSDEFRAEYCNCYTPIIIY